MPTAYPPIHGRSRGEAAASSVDSGRRVTLMSTARQSDISQAPAHLRGLLRHFADLRDGTHGDGAVTRAEKERLFASAVGRLDLCLAKPIRELE
jgi:hypothetical protein